MPVLEITTSTFNMKNTVQQQQNMTIMTVVLKKCILNYGTEEKTKDRNYGTTTSLCVCVCVYERLNKGRKGRKLFRLKPCMKADHLGVGIILILQQTGPVVLI